MTYFNPKNMYFQQYGAVPYFANEVMQLLKNRMAE